MRALNSSPNVVADNNSFDYPTGRIKDNNGTSNGTGVNERVYGDLHQTIAKLMRLYAITPNGLPDNETNGFQIVDALKSLASKNDYIYPLSSVSGVLSVDIKFANMQNGEFIVCRASVDKTTETQIKGIGATTFTIAYSGSFKANEYVRVIKTSGGVSIVRLADWNSLSAMATDLGFLKKASQSEENAGSIDTVATTPLTNLVAFTRRVIGLDSGDFLATTGNNGLYSSAHFDIVAGLGASPVKNYGTVTFDPAGSTGSLAVSGDIASATATIIGLTSVITVTVDNAMDDTNFLVETFVQGQSANIENDGGFFTIVFKPTGTTTFQLTTRDYQGGAQSLKVHLRVVQL
jgi:hypothetical protein